MFGLGVERSGLKANEFIYFIVDCIEVGEGERGFYLIYRLLFFGEESFFRKVLRVVNFELGNSLFE